MHTWSNETYNTVHKILFHLLLKLYQKKYFVLCLAHMEIIVGYNHFHLAQDKF